MSLSFTVTAGHTFPAGRPITLAALRLAARPGLAFTGSVATGDMADGAVTPSKTSPGAFWYAAASGTNAYTATLSPALGSLANGVLAVIKFTNANTAAAAPTLDVNSLGAKNVYHRSGQAPKSGDIQANDIFILVYNTSRNTGAGGWDILAKMANDLVRLGTCAGSANAYTVTSANAPAANDLAGLVGQVLLVKATFANTGAATLAVDGLTAKPLRKRANAALISDDIKLGEYFACTYDDTDQTFHIISRDEPAAVIAGGRNIVLQNNAANPNTQIDVTADEVVLKTSDGAAYLAIAVNVTANIAATGANPNALDTGAEAGDTWYYIWLIYNGTTVASLISASATAPTLPTGYTYKALIGAVRNDGSSNFVKTYQHDRRVWIDDTNVFTGKAAAADNTWEILASADLTAFRAAIPPTARHVSGTLGWSATAVGSKIAIAGCNADGSVNTTNAVGATYAVGAQNAAAWNTFTFGTSFIAPVRGGASYNLQWKADRPDATGRSRLNVSGYTF